MARLFVALWPSADTLKALAEMPRPDVPGVRWTTPERLHSTLRFLGAASESAVADALEALRLPAVTVTLGPGVERLGRAVLMIPAEGADGLAAAVIAATGHFGQPPPKRPFIGHLTVARFKRRPPPGYSPAVKTSFEAREIALVRVEPSGAYTNVKRFALASPRR